MIEKNRQFWYLYFALVFIVLIRIIPFLYPESRTWGFNHLIFLPSVYSYAFFSIALISLIIPFINKSEVWSEWFIDWFSNRFFESPRKYYYRAVFILSMAVLFIVFTAPTHFLGDGYILINVLSDSYVISHEWNDVHLFKWSEIGAARLILIAQSVFGEASKQNTILAFQTISVVSGLIYIWFSFLIANILSNSKVKQIVIFISTLFSGVMLMFFGYVEYYHFIWIFMLGHIYFSIKFIKTNSGLLISWLFLIFGTILHLQILLFIPSAIIAFLTSDKGRFLVIRFKKTFIITLGVGLLGVLGLVGYKYWTDLYIEHMFLTMYSGKLDDPSYAILSSSHLIDIVNEVILVFPMIVMIVVVKWSRLKLKNISRESIYLLISAFSCFLFLFLIDPQLEMPRDWDLFSLTIFPSILLLAVCLDDGIGAILRRTLISVSLILFISFTPFIITNLNTESSVKYMEYMADSKNEKSMSSLFILYGYYEKHGSQEKADSLKPLFNQRYPTMQKRVKAGKAMNKGDFETARNLLNSIEFNKYDAILQKLYSRYNYLTGDYNLAMEYIENALQLRKYNADNYGDRAKIYLALGNSDKALEDLRHGFNLRGSSKYILDGLANTFFSLNQYDSTIFYAQKRLLIDSTKANYYYMLAYSYAYKNNINMTQKYCNKFAEFNLNDKRYKSRLNKLSELIVRLKTVN